MSADELMFFVCDDRVEFALKNEPPVELDSETQSKLNAFTEELYDTYISRKAQIA